MLGHVLSALLTTTVNHSNGKKILKYAACDQVSKQGHSFIKQIILKFHDLYIVQIHVQTINVPEIDGS